MNAIDEVRKMFEFDTIEALQADMARQKALDIGIFVEGSNSRDHGIQKGNPGMDRTKLSA